MGKRMLGVLCAAASLAASSPASAQSVFVGKVSTFAFTFCPAGYAPLNGTLFAISENPTLFNLIGTTFGGDGVNTFAVPTGKPVSTLTPGADFIQCISLFGIYPSQN